MKILLLTVSMCCLSFSEPPTVHDIPLPQGYSRIAVARGTYGYWITRLPLKADNAIRAFDGSLISNSGYSVFKVVNLPLLFRQDLEQCADFAFRLWADYHKNNDLLGKLYLFDYEGNRRFFKDSGKSYNAFLKWTMVHANSHSIKEGCAKIPVSEIKHGDMIVQNETGGIGHVSVIMDICSSPENKRLYLIGFSFMPAQEFHIEYARDGYGNAGWFSIDGYYRYLAEYLDLGNPVCRRFDQP
jgi:hypothetical protein